MVSNCEEYRAEVPRPSVEECDGLVGKIYYRCMAAAEGDYDKYVDMLIEDYTYVLLATQKNKTSMCGYVNDPYLKNRCQTDFGKDIVGEDLISEVKHRAPKYLGYAIS